LDKDGSVVADTLDVDGLIQADLASVFDDTVPGANIVANGTFNVNTAGWTPVGANLSSVPGGYDGNCLEIETQGAGNAIAWQSYSGGLIPGELYRISFYFRILGPGSGGGQLKIGTSPEAWDLYHSGSIYDFDWAEHTGSFVVTAGAGTIYITLVSLGSGHPVVIRHCYLDSIVIYRVAGGNLAVGDHLSAGQLSVLNDVSMPGIKSGVDQAAAGAVAGEVWADTDDDNTLKLGV